MVMTSSLRFTSARSARISMMSTACRADLRGGIASWGCCAARASLTAGIVYVFLATATARQKEDLSEKMGKDLGGTRARFYNSIARAWDGVSRIGNSCWGRAITSKSYVIYVALPLSSYLSEYFSVPPSQLLSLHFLGTKAPLTQVPTIMWMSGGGKKYLEVPESRPERASRRANESPLKQRRDDASNGSGGSRSCPLWNSSQAISSEPLQVARSW